ncbi:hypothetical protein XENOCAPTIV_025146 [Xenoophorus captivus]|uniref:Uncharacterized protein n=1 Tax=Xenoophorus captivus TaxID=1517983 RepID=A0ABV0QTE5_9TELE
MKKSLLSLKLSSVSFFHLYVCGNELVIHFSHAFVSVYVLTGIRISQMFFGFFQTDGHKHTGSNTNVKRVHLLPSFLGKLFAALKALFGTQLCFLMWQTGTEILGRGKRYFVKQSFLHMLFMA